MQGLDVVRQSLIDNQILELIKQRPDITDTEIASQLGLKIDEVIDRIESLSDTRVKILIVDDEKDVVVPLKMSLEADNYSVIEAYAGYGAIEKARSEIPDLIILDLMLPDMDGYEVCNRLREDPLTELIPIIMLTGKDDISNKIEGLERGADDYITKPFNLSELKARIRTVLRRSRV
ncbi:response regulator with CheY-like receiver domain and winged-helix DNA-binding domain [Candidatus Methanoperedens nitroreducens]|uniref:Response regulator with CheY-like receiver domain and winged-helix DNA-binding domain n=1 Tax=Candidatus Methanoperedens nitratireducens TaxID=1392998 RepID=A0A062V8N9_9EURY|nr:response regulator [Candidatus Methanoperedens nitroreducens]KCZ72124.1 response regulator with CheY-like receiver domain and winged-helix DNA-binding domain [Candidatus Methanoperedens nitroreducens]MDJ1421899.1 response regulator [Candidatus Methanoperedens sp.]